MYEDFEAKAVIAYWHTVKVTADSLPKESVSCMCITSGDRDIYITKEQAMKFFGLVESEAVAEMLERQHTWITNVAAANLVSTMK